MSVTKIRGNFQIENGSIIEDHFSNGAVTVNKLADNIDASAKNFNAAKVGGKAVDDNQSPSSNYLWTSNKIGNEINEKINGLLWETPCDYMIHYIKTTTGDPTGTGLEYEKCLNTNDKKLYTYGVSSWDSGIFVNDGEYRFLFGKSGSDTSGNSGTYTVDNKIYSGGDASYNGEVPSNTWAVMIYGSSKNVEVLTAYVYQSSSSSWINFWYPFTNFIEDDFELVIDFKTITSYEFIAPYNLILKFVSSENTMPTLSVSLNTEIYQYEKILISPTAVGLVSITGNYYILNNREIEVNINFKTLTPFVYNVSKSLIFTNQYSEDTAATFSTALGTTLNKYDKLTITPTALGLITLVGRYVV